MELKQKGSEANVGGFNQLMVFMKWTTAFNEGVLDKFSICFFGGCVRCG